MIELRFTLSPDEYVEGLLVLQRDVKRLLRQSRWSIAVMVQWAVFAVLLVSALVVFSLWHKPTQAAPTPNVDVDPTPLRFFLVLFAAIFCSSSSELHVHAGSSSSRYRSPPSVSIKIESCVSIVKAFRSAMRSQPQRTAGKRSFASLRRRGS